MFRKVKIKQMKNSINNQKKARLLHFHEWKRHGYSLFQALKHEVHIATLAVAYLYIAAPQDAVAQSAQDSLKITREYEIDEIEISAQRAPSTYSQIARVVSVISRKEIEAAPVASVQDLLEYATGVDIRQRGTYGVQSDISIRGGSFDQVLILLNGVNISDPQTGHHNLNLPLSLKSVNRIEILNGASARVYGPNAFSGAINIITDPAYENELNTDIMFGEHGLRDINVSGTIKTGSLRNFVSFENSASNGYRNNTDFKNYNFFYHGEINTNVADISLQTGYSDKGFGANGFYSPKYPNQYEATKTTFVAAQVKTDNILHSKFSTYWRRNKDRFELFRNNPESWYSGHNYHMTDVFGLNYNTWIMSKLGKSAVGAELRSENILSNQLGKPLEDSISVPSEKNQFFTNGHSRTVLSYYAEHSLYIKKLSITIGAMGNWISDLHNSWNIYPGIDLSYKLTNQLKAYASFNKALRMPTYTDLYYSGPTNKGNPSLKPEESTSFETGLKYNNKIITAESSIYYQLGKNTIDWVRISDDFLWQPQNLTQINSFGIELNSSYQLNKISSFFNNAEFNYAYNSLTRKETNYISNYALDNLKHKAVIGINHNILNNLTANWKLRYEERNGGYSKFEDTVYIGETDYKPYTLVDLKLNYKLRKINFYIIASNLFNIEYYDMGNLPLPKRWVSAGVNFKIQ